MRICLLGDTRGNSDEGMKNVARQLESVLSKKHQILLINPIDLLSKKFWLICRDFNPDIIHYIPGPSILSFIVLKIIKLYCKDTKTVMSAMHPSFYGFYSLSFGPYYFFSSIFSFAIPFFKPNLVLILSQKSEMMFRKLGCKTRFFPIGVDTVKFKPVSSETKKKLRKKYNVDLDKFIILHVGHINKKRNIQFLSKLQTNNNQVIIVGSTSTTIEQDLYQKLINEGCLIWTNYFANLEEVYALSDCYIFPTFTQIASIELPLSVLEAMSCNLPVITTKFGALPRIFNSSDGLFFAEINNDIFEALETIKSNNLIIKTREKVQSLSWENIGEELLNVYSELLN